MDVKLPTLLIPSVGSAHEDSTPLTLEFMFWKKQLSWRFPHDQMLGFLLRLVNHPSTKDLAQG
jgi:hypothetical protein